MTVDEPCDDLRCVCCHPEEQHTCDVPHAFPGEPGDSETCLECGAVWTCHEGRPEWLPSDMRWPDGLWWQADRPLPLVSELRRSTPP